MGGVGTICTKEVVRRGLKINKQKEIHRWVIREDKERGKQRERCGGDDCELCDIIYSKGGIW